MKQATSKVPLLVRAGALGIALFAAVSCGPPDDSTSSGAGGQGTSTGTTGTSTSITTGTVPTGPNCQIPPGAASNVGEAIPAKGITCTRYPFPLTSPRDVLVASDGAVFVTEFDAGRISKLTDNGFVTITEGLVAPIGLREDDDGSLLVTEEGKGTLARVDRQTGTRTTIANISGHVTYLARGHDGAAYVSSFKSLDDNNLGGVYRVDLASGAVTPFITGLDVPEGLHYDPEFLVYRVADWLAPGKIVSFSESGGNGAGKSSILDGLTNVYGLISDNHLGYLAADSVGRIVQVSEEGYERDVLIGLGTPGGMAANPDGTLWIAEFVGFGQTGYLIRLEGL